MGGLARILLLDDDEGLLATAHASFPGGRGLTLETRLLDKVGGEATLRRSLRELDEQPATLLVVDWTPLGRNAEMTSTLRALSVETRRRVILASWMPPPDFAAAAGKWGLQDLEQVHKPFAWEDVLVLRESGTRSQQTVADGDESTVRRVLWRAADGQFREAPSLAGACKHWPHADFTAEQLAWLEERKELVTPCRGRLPWKPASIDWYQIVSLPKADRGSPTIQRVVQYAIRRPENWEPPEPDNAVVDVFRLMSEVGFWRARYYEIYELPDEPKTRVLQLIHTNYPLREDGRLVEPAALLPVSRTLHNTLMQRADAWLRRSRLAPNKLVYVARGREAANGAHPGDPDILFWNGLVDAEDLSAWLEVPIYEEHAADPAADPHPGDDLALLGWMIFDRKANPATDRSSEIHDTLADDPLVEIGQIKDRVRMVQVPLLEALAKVREQKQSRDNQVDRRQSKRRQDLREQLALAGAWDAPEKDLVRVATLAGEAGAHGAPESSVFFARYSSATKSLYVTEDTSGKLKGKTFSIPSKHAMTRCAQAKKLVVVPNWKDLDAADRIGIDDWLQVPDVTPEQARALDAWHRQNVFTSVALPVLSKGNALLGVLVESHQRPYHFSRARIASLVALVDTARPYMELAAVRESSARWDAAVMHEIRAGIALPYRSLSKLWEQQLDKDEYRLTLKSVLHAVEDLRDLANMFLECLGHSDPRARQFAYERDVGEDGKWFQSIQEYGNGRARQWGTDKPFHVGPAWRHGQVPGVAAPERLIRVVRALLDNGFKYGEPGVPVSLVLVEQAGTMTVEVRNGGMLSEAVIGDDLRSCHERLDLGGRALRVHIGLALAKGLVQEQEQILRLDNVVEHGQPLVLARFAWPIAVRTRSIAGERTGDAIY